MRNCSIQVKEDEKRIIIEVLRQQISIDYSGDIDFTELVSILTKLMDEPTEIVLQEFEESTDHKLKLVLDTLKGIFVSYNESIISMTEEVNPPFIPPPPIDEDDRLPF
jgi:hypothetical protein